jgi:hypothetical protein
MSASEAKADIAWLSFVTGRTARRAPPMRCFDIAAVRTPGEAAHESAACAGIFHSYQQLLRIATQPTTQHPHRIDIQGIFVPKHSLRDGFTAYSELSPVNGLFCHRHP